MKHILFGSGGTAGLGYEKGIQEISELGLNALEVEFTHGINLSDSQAKKIGELAQEKKISLSVHAPYFINLASDEKHKIEASKKRIADACRKSRLLGARKVVFHPAFYGKREKDEVFDIVKLAVDELHKFISEEKLNVVLCPETTGKPSQFGTLDELIALAKATGCGICIDFAHIYARNNGRIDYDEILKKVKGIKNLHAHFSGIEYGEKGEKRHILTSEKLSRALIEKLLQHKISLTIINESPDPINDAKMMSDVFRKISE